MCWWLLLQVSQYSKLIVALASQKDAEQLMWICVHHISASDMFKTFLWASNNISGIEHPIEIYGDRLSICFEGLWKPPPSPLRNRDEPCEERGAGSGRLVSKNSKAPASAEPREGTGDLTVTLLGFHHEKTGSVSWFPAWTPGFNVLIGESAIKTGTCLGLGIIGI